MTRAADPTIGETKRAGSRQMLANGVSNDVARLPAFEPASDLDWLLPLAGITAIELGLWLFVWRAGVAPRPLIARYGILGDLILSLVGLIAFSYQLLRMALRGESRPLRCSAEMLRTNGPRILVIVVAVQLSALSGAAFSALKTAMQNIAPFWVDPYVATFELWLFGREPYALSRHVFGWATPAIDFVYATWFFMQLLVFYVLVLTKPSQLKTRALISQSLSWLILGVCAAYPFSSAGPIFYDRIFGGHNFAGLLATLDRAPLAARTSAMLWKNYSLHTNELGSGISAIPSLHVAMAYWMAMVIQGGWPRLRSVGWTYFGLICLGSIHLGWHYVTDGIVATAGAALIWGVSGNFTRQNANKAKGEVRVEPQV